MSRITLRGREFNAARIIILKADRIQMRPDYNAVTDHSNALIYRSNRGLHRAQQSSARPSQLHYVTSERGVGPVYVYNYHIRPIDQMYGPLQSRYAPEGENYAPEFTGRIGDQWAAYGENIVLSCRVMGKPVPNVSWYKDNKKITASPRVFLHYDGNVATLKIYGAKASDGGWYSCRAENQYALRESKGMVYVNDTSGLMWNVRKSLKDIRWQHNRRYLQSAIVPTRF